MGIVRSSIQYLYTNSGSTTITAGSGVQIGTAGFGVAAADIPAGATGVLDGSGVYTLGIASSTTAAAGDIAYWNASTGKVVTSGASKLQIGTFANASASGETECTIAVFPTAIVTAAGA